MYTSTMVRIWVRWNHQPDTYINLLTIYIYINHILTIIRHCFTTNQWWFNHQEMVAFHLFQGGRDPKKMETSTVQSPMGCCDVSQWENIYEKKP
jgi:hypothetical protein